MLRKFLHIFAFLALTTIPSFADAAIIVSFVRTSAANLQNVTIDVFARADTGSQLVGAYGLTVTLSAPASNIVGTPLPAPTVDPNPTNSWAGLKNNSAGANGSAGLTFRGGLAAFGLNNDPFNVTIGSVLNDATTRIGSISFLATTTEYTISATPATTGRQDITGAGTGFFQVLSSTSASQVSGVSSTTPLTITTVPEPTSIAMLGLCLGGLGFRKLRTRLVRKS